ncbi:ferritin-like domain-containing protein [Desulfofustis glycolicus]|uniref:Rubrerythrin n=1 Tax=Desulfofustis glycolicus DSM 9705 TaxID=1121409 RepID=A0A1M5RVP0_9BACT|nr:ferritin family protein [Desulfofustis glycolicus]MCB2216359.1 ferritin family protein [Desulfobulbaceae bacterium]SHH30392.1 Rubrerythrin [Desulfofustis glycolicus DSM 9705]
MDPFAFSIQMEKDAEALYRKMADNTPAAGVKKVLLLLAEDEVKHRKAIEQLQKRMNVEPQEGVALDIKTVFDEMKQDKDFTSLSEDAVEDYRKAVEIEKRGIAFYQEKFAEATDPTSKKLFEALMKQESYHLRTCESLLDMVQKPEWWVENAEFNPRDNNEY